MSYYANLSHRSVCTVSVLLTYSDCNAMMSRSSHDTPLMYKYLYPMETVLCGQSVERGVE